MKFLLGKNNVLTQCSRCCSAVLHSKLPRSKIIIRYQLLGQRYFVRCSPKDSLAFFLYRPKAPASAGATAATAAAYQTDKAHAAHSTHGACTVIDQSEAPPQSDWFLIDGQPVAAPVLCAHEFYSLLFAAAAATCKLSLFIRSRQRGVTDERGNCGPSHNLKLSY